MKRGSYRTHKWINTETRKPQFGVQMLVDKQWFHCSDDKGAIFYDFEYDAEARVIALNEEDKEQEQKHA